MTTTEIDRKIPPDWLEDINRICEDVELQKDLGSKLVKVEVTDRKITLTYDVA